MPESRTAIFTSGRPVVTCQAVSTPASASAMWPPRTPKSSAGLELTRLRCRVLGRRRVHPGLLLGEVRRAPRRRSGRGRSGRSRRRRRARTGSRRAPAPRRASVAASSGERDQRPPHLTRHLLAVLDAVALVDDRRVVARAAADQVARLVRRAQDHVVAGAAAQAVAARAAAHPVVAGAAARRVAAGARAHAVVAALAAKLVVAAAAGQALGSVRPDEVVRPRCRRGARPRRAAGSGRRGRAARCRSTRPQLPASSR